MRLATHSHTDDRAARLAEMLLKSHLKKKQRRPACLPAQPLTACPALIMPAAAACGQALLLKRSYQATVGSLAAATAGQPPSHM